MALNRYFLFLEHDVWVKGIEKKDNYFILVQVHLKLKPKASERPCQCQHTSHHTEKWNALFYCALSKAIELFHCETISECLSPCISRPVWLHHWVEWQHNHFLPEGPSNYKLLVEECLEKMIYWLNLKINRNIFYSINFKQQIWIDKLIKNKPLANSFRSNR